MSDERHEWVATRWIRLGDIGADRHQMPSVELTISPFYEGNRYAVRDGCGGCMNASGEWEYEPMPSSRDDAFYERCRFKTFDDATHALDTAHT